jgi:tetratricopeptide (TPR) repeat protein
MLYRTFIASLGIALLLAAPIQAARGGAAARAGAARADVDAELDRLRAEGFTALYSLEYGAAGRAFGEMIRVAPDRPEGYLFRATNTWFESLFKKRLLSTNLYARDEFYEQKERAIEPAVDKSFRADLQKAISLGEARVKASPNDIEALYYLGAAHGSLAGYEASMARAFMSALKHGSKSVDLHEKVVKQDPKYADAYLTIGMYHYVVGSLPLPVKLLAAVGGVRGSKKDGLAEIERVVREARRNADDARVVLVGLYMREGRREDALALLRELKAKYPANYVIALEEASVLAQLGRREEAYAAYDALLETPRATAKAKDFIDYWYAEALRAGGEHARALEHYSAVWQWKGADADLVTLARLGAGQCLDALGRRPEAVASYEIVKERPDILDSRRKAERFLKDAYSPSQPMAQTGQAASAS